MGKCQENFAVRCWLCVNTGVSRIPCVGGRVQQIQGNLRNANNADR